MQRLRVSQYLSIVPRDDGFAVYHKLFGNLALLNRSGMGVLQSFITPASPDGRCASFENVGAFVTELRDRFFLVPESMDERAIIAQDVQYRTQRLESGYLIQGLQLVLTNDCNLGCTYCFTDTLGAPAPSSDKPKPKVFEIRAVAGDTPASGGCGGGAPAVPKPKKMSSENAVEAVRNTLAVLRKNGNRALSVEFFGGEPLLNWPAIEQVLETFGAGDDDVALFYSITTNASVVTDEIARKLRDHNVTAMVSFDSPKNVNRLTKRGTSADHLITRGIDILTRNGARVTFNTVVSVNNVDDFDADGLLETARSYGIDTVALILDLAVKPYEDASGVSKVMGAILDCCEKARSYGITITGYWHQIFEQMIGRRALNLQKGYKTCAAEGCKLSVEPDGSISNCKCGSKPIGHVRNLDEVFRTEAYRSYALKAYEATPQCAGCEIEGFCSGLCMGTLENTFGNVSVRVDPTCQLYRALTANLVRSTPIDELERMFLEPHATGQVGTENAAV